jgi:hypothetical protein
MASYTALGSYTTVKSYAPGTSETIQMVSFVTSPTGVFCEYGVPHDAFVQEGSGAGDQPLIQNLADAIEAVASQVSCVTGGTFVQDIDQASGLLTDYVQYFLTYTASSTGGTFATTVNVPVNDFFTEETGIGGLIIPPSPGFTPPADRVGEACAALKALAGG